MELPDLYMTSNILVIDDNAANVYLLEELLEDDGYKNIETCTDPFKALELIKTSKFDLILLDIQMPGMNGFEVLEKLREFSDDDYLPVVILSAQNDYETRMRALREGAKDFLTKPFNNSEVLLRVHNLLEMRSYHTLLKNQNNHLEEMVKQRTQEVERTRMEIVSRLCTASEFRDNSTGEHITRIGLTCHLLAKQAGQSTEYCDLILNASLMHDIGKIGIADNILLKESALDPDEWNLMRQHVEIGAKMLEGDESPLIKMAHDIALSHHEKWDGSGYPKGLSGEDIPLEGRICMICDVFDALTSARSYKEAWTVEKSMAFIKEKSGLFFDPDLVHHFEDILDQIVEIRFKHPDTKYL